MEVSEHKMGRYTAWAMAVGGMIGGGIYTLAGVILGVAGPLAWVSLVGGGLIALATVRSYYDLTREVGRDGVPLTFLLHRGHPRVAGVLAWWLLLVYVLAMAVYAFTFGQYLGGTIGAPRWVSILLVFGIVTLLALVNLRGIKEPAKVQIVAVVIELSILAVIAVMGFWNWNPENVAQGVPAGSVGGVLTGMAATFIAFEGFEMLAYDLRETRKPRLILTLSLPAAVVAVAIAYAVVTIGAASLVGAGELVAQKEHALAVAGSRAAGTPGLVVVCIAACASAASAINATLFSVSRMMRSGAEAGLLPSKLACQNARGCPHYAVLLLALLAACLASAASLDPLIQAASLAFLVLFAYVNTLAWRTSKNWISLFGAVSAVGSALIVLRELAVDHPLALAAFGGAWAVSVIAHMILQGRRKAAGAPPAEAPETPPLPGFTEGGIAAEEGAAGG
jgi:amino acid transporter